MRPLLCLRKELPDGDTLTVVATPDVIEDE